MTQSTAPDPSAPGPSTPEPATADPAIEALGLRFAGLVVFCADIAASARFYADGLGLEQVDQTGADGQDIAFHLPTAGDPHGAWLLLHAQTDDKQAPYELGTFAVDDVDALVARLEHAGFPIAQPPQDAPWGVREAWVSDVDGYGLTLNSPLRSS